MTDEQATLVYDLSDALLSNAVITAVEGATGYWAQVSGYEWKDDADFAIAYLHEIDPDTGESAETGQRFGMAEAADGIRRLLSGQVPVADYIRTYVVRALLEDDPGHIDGEAADCIAQAALLGEIRYG